MKIHKNMRRFRSCGSTDAIYGKYYELKIYLVVGLKKTSNYHAYQQGTMHEIQAYGNYNAKTTIEPFALII